MAWGEPRTCKGDLGEGAWSLYPGHCRRCWKQLSGLRGLLVCVFAQSLQEAEFLDLGRVGAGRKEGSRGGPLRLKTLCPAYSWAERS